MNAETREFVAEFLPKHVEAERLLHAGDARPRMALWSRNDPITVLGAKESGQGWAQLEPLFKAVAGWFSEVISYDFELIAAGVSGDMAYTVGYEHSEVVVDGTRRTYTLRATHVYRREDGEWRTVHRHADFPPEGGNKLSPDE
ncbi:nuclear transport factor 2 family protein [Kribbella sp. NBC_01245]|uniref:YybH family protein n=1 Tax=Kribbella sp. NBC_01245 TaxID=2903578 RepID=UPI002E2DDCB9|nr:nuclear transport factor 2 family protein [Kribbella sp. NBC_01245]